MTTAHHGNPVATAVSISRRRLMAGLVLLVGGVVFGALPAAAGGDILSAEETLKRLEAGQLTLIDVRSPREWRQTGIAQGAKTITIHDPLGIAGFIAKIKAMARGDLAKPVALICAVGGRSSRAADILRRVGFKSVYNVREGMLGNIQDGPGWLKRGLPIMHSDSLPK